MTDQIFKPSADHPVPLRAVDNGDGSFSLAVSLVGGGAGGAVDSVNAQTGVVVLDPDDLDDASTVHKFVSAAEKTKIAAAITSAYTDEMARDALGSALVAGTGVTITVNDAADTITIAASGGGATTLDALTNKTTDEDLVITDATKGYVGTASNAVAWRLRPATDGGLVNETINTTVNFVDDFENGIDSGWSLPDATNVTIDGTTASVGSKSVKLAGNNAASAVRSISRTFIVTAGSTCTFALKVSSEATFDKLEFWLDGVSQQAWSGTVAWVDSSAFSLSAGAHTLKWTYTKDTSGNAGSDAAWIDNVRVTNVTPGALSVKLGADVAPRPGSWYGKVMGITSSMTLIGVIPAWNITSGVGSTDDDANGVWLKYGTGATSGNSCGAGSASFIGARRGWGSVMKAWLKLIDVASVRLWIGLFGADPSGSAAPSAHLAAFRFDTGAGDTHWQAVTNSGGGTQTVTDTGITPASGDRPVMEIRLSGSDVVFLLNGMVVATHTTNLPGATTDLGYQEWITTLSAAAKQGSVGTVAIWSMGRS